MERLYSLNYGVAGDFILDNDILKDNGKMIRKYFGVLHEL